ncbi:hypothetical protein [Rhizobium sp. Leaf386]|uniref:hypothetical protein n=1 Tax=Rhizobium sp. Leaf386 TaxID=1736359 RepID=UPI0007124912|nr:hypothetical protein [Rhizobium sp. Leaf386]KQT04149.1 hypothetical protein ASG50_18290 [Rhizobium sp. Leaf386]
MATDWFTVLQDEGKKARAVTERLKASINDPGVTEADAAANYREVENAAQAFDHMYSRMEDEDAPDEVFDAAETLQEQWAMLATLAVNKLRMVQGKPAIEYPEG